MDVPFRLVDVFTERPFAGNQLCVVPETPAGMTTEQMHTVAQEIGFSETTFVTEAGGDRYAMRIFTPNEELPFAGHPTLGTAFILATDGTIAPEATQTTAIGEVPVEVELERGFAWMRQRPPEFRDVVDDRAAVAAAIGLGPEELGELPPQVVSTGLAPLLIPVRDEATLRRAERDARLIPELARRAGAECLYVFAVRGEGDVMARMFDPFFGIGEDPATGSAAGPLGAFLARHALAGLPGRGIVAQGELVDRPSFLHLNVRAEEESFEINVGGGVRLVGEGVFRGV
jgi:trans-2,3-dihydro-3-hydroxyanthranilate isomerase